VRAEMGVAVGSMGADTPIEPPTMSPTEVEEEESDGGAGARSDCDT